MTEKYILEKIFDMSKDIRGKRAVKYNETWKQMTEESLIDFAKAKLERYKYSNNLDDIVDILNYIEFVLRRRASVDFSKTKILSEQM